MRTKPKPKFTMIVMRGLECRRCGHRWIPRVKDVRLCAKCKSVYFDTPRRPPKKRVA